MKTTTSFKLSIKSSSIQKACMSTSNWGSAVYVPTFGMVH